MTRLIKTDATLSSPIDIKKDQVEETRRVLGEMNDKAGMSALPPTTTAKANFPHKVMSAITPKADMCSATRDVRFGPKTDIFDLRQRWSRRATITPKSASKRSV